MEQYQENSRRTRRVAAAQVVLAELTRPAEVVPVVLERTDAAQQGFEAVYTPFQVIVPDTNMGFDSEGNYHCPSLRTEHLNG